MLGCARKETRVWKNHNMRPGHTLRDKKPSSIVHLLSKALARRLQKVSWGTSSTQAAMLRRLSDAHPREDSDVQAGMDDEVHNTSFNVTSVCEELLLASYNEECKHLSWLKRSSTWSGSADKATLGCMSQAQILSIARSVQMLTPPARPLTASSICQGLFSSSAYNGTLSYTMLHRCETTSLLTKSNVKITAEQLTVTPLRRRTTDA